MFWIPYKEAKFGELNLALEIGFSLLRQLRATLPSCFSSDPSVPCVCVGSCGFHGFRLYLVMQTHKSLGWTRLGAPGSCWDCWPQTQTGDISCTLPGLSDRRRRDSGSAPHWCFPMSSAGSWDGGLSTQTPRWWPRVKAGKVKRILPTPVEGKRWGPQPPGAQQTDG